MPEQPLVVALHYFSDAVALPRFFRIGRETHRTGETYDWDCRLRTDPHCLFAYTESGRGALEIEGAWHDLEPGFTFMIEVPGPFRYRLSELADEWTLKYLAVSLDTLPLWTRIIAQTGRLFLLQPDSPLMEVFDDCWHHALNNTIADLYENSALLYRFLMACLRLSESVHPPLSNSVRTCQALIDARPERPWTLSDLAQATGLSPYHLVRTFRQQVGDTPIRYLLKRRIGQAVQLLIETEQPITRIAQETGFDNANYFAKAFRHWMNLSPSQFRQRARDQGIDRMHVR